MFRQFYKIKKETLALHKFLSSSIVEIRETIAFYGQMLDAGYIKIN